MPECLSCAMLADPVEQRDRLVMDGAYWSIRHAYPVKYLGWFVIVLKRHCEAMHDLLSEESTELANLQHRLIRAINLVLQPEREYVGVFHEKRGFNHVHVHVIAKPEDLPSELTGSRIFSTLKDATPNTSPQGQDIAALCFHIRSKM